MISTGYELTRFGSKAIGHCGVLRERPECHGASSGEESIIYMLARWSACAILLPHRGQLASYRTGHLKTVRWAPLPELGLGSALLRSEAWAVGAA